MPWLQQIPSSVVLRQRTPSKCHYSRYTRVMPRSQPPSNSSSSSSPYHLASPPVRRLGTPITVVARGHRLRVRLGDATASSPTRTESSSSLPLRSTETRRIINRTYSILGSMYEPTLLSELEARDGSTSSITDAPSASTVVGGPFKVHHNTVVSTSQPNAKAVQTEGSPGSRRSKCSTNSSTNIQ